MVYLLRSTASRNGHEVVKAGFLQELLLQGPEK
jgi:hypothetical protein